MMHRAFGLIAAAGTLGLCINVVLAQPTTAPATQPKAPAPAQPGKPTVPPQPGNQAPPIIPAQPIKTSEPPKVVPLEAKKAPAPPTRTAPTFADADMQAVATALAGSWKTNGLSAGDVVINAAPVSIAGVPNTIYAEVARAEALNRPFRQAIWQLHRAGGKLRMKTLEFRHPRGEMGSAVGLWAAPDVFPMITNDDLVATLDIELTKNGNGWKGQTLHSYPTTVNGASEMTSNISFDGATFTTIDRGMDADGKVVWGTPEGFSFKKFDAGVKVQRMDSGMVAVDFPSKTDGDAAKPGDKLSLNYTAYLENGTMYDSSFERGQPWVYAVGAPSAVPGWVRATADLKKGTQRRVVIPSALAFGERGLPGRVPANANLYFDIQVVDVASSGMKIGDEMKPGDPNGPDFKKMEEKMRQMKEAELKKTNAGANPLSDHPPKP